MMLTGVASNRLVSILNGGMPFPSFGSIPPSAFNGRIPIWQGTRLKCLADIIPVPWGWASAGDAMIVLGLAVFSVASILYLYQHGGALRFQKVFHLAR